MPDAGCLHFIYGKPAAGKTTLARRIAAEQRAVVFCEDEWLVRLEAECETFESFLAERRKLRAALAPHMIQLLRLGCSIVLDFAANGPRERAWVRSLFEAAGADHHLHMIEASDDFCRARLRQRNATKPDGIYWGEVSETTFDQVLPKIVPPVPEEGFTITRYQAEQM